MDELEGRAVPSAVPLGPEFPVADGAVPAAAANAAGDYVVAWQADGLVGDGSEIFARRYDAAGRVLSNAFRVNAVTAGDQTDPTVAVAPDGGFVVVWHGPEGGGAIHGQRFGPGGERRGPELRVDPPAAGGHAMYPAVAATPAGGFVVAWQAPEGYPNGFGIYARRYSRLGQPLGAPIHVTADVPFDQADPAVAVDGRGNFVIAWTSWFQDGSVSGIYARRYAPGGRSLGPEFLVNTTTRGYQTFPAVAADPAGAFVVAWQGDSPEENGQKVFFQRYDPAGIPQGGEVRATTEAVVTGVNFAHPSIGMDAAGGFTVAWQREASEPTGYVIQARQYGPAGEEGEPFAVSTATSPFQGQSAVAMVPSGAFAVAWRADRSGVPGVYARLYVPAIVTLSNKVVPENNAPPTWVGTLSATSSDPAETFTFSLVPGTGAADNAAFRVAGADLLADRVFDYEAQSEYHARVRATGSLGTTFDQPFVIGVTDTAEAAIINGDLVVEGTVAADAIRVEPDADGQVVLVKFAGLVNGSFPLAAVTGRVVVHGRGGPDVVTLSARLPRPADLYGEDGEDQLAGGSGDDRLFGGPGDDLLDGGAGNDVLVGGVGGDRIAGRAGRDLALGGDGADRLAGGWGDDLLVAGPTAIDDDPAWLADVAREWTSADDHPVRVAHLMGTAGGQNGTTVLTAATVGDDLSRDVVVGGPGPDWLIWSPGDVVIDLPGGTRTRV